MIVATVPTIGWHVYTNPPTGNGANTAFTGAFGDVDEVVLNDVELISGAADGAWKATRQRRAATYAS